ncbi:MAG TPA: TIGR03084 family metal-binding protein [Mycobacteriales bacterium]|jgi:uncharacterized protein (TIGR03084 family)|nr:TIGR03084 family metal-binding protein [Mycobacteriales bacterium]
MSDRPDLAALLADLRDEQADLQALVEGSDLAAPTPAVGWDVRATVSHLAGTDLEARKAAVDPERFRRELAEPSCDVTSLLERHIEARRPLSREELLTAWQAGFSGMLDAFAALPPGTKVPWYGPPMSPASFATARLMEYWAHGQDVVDAVGAVRPPTARLRHICHLGVRTRGFSYVNRGRAAPAGEVRVALTAPDGTGWTWGQGPDAVLGSAEHFCLLVTQRRHRADLDLVATGPLADSWLDVAQAFAGPPGPGRPPS